MVQEMSKPNSKNLEEYVVNVREVHRDGQVGRRLLLADVLLSFSMAKSRCRQEARADLDVEDVM